MNKMGQGTSKSAFVRKETALVNLSDAYVAEVVEQYGGDASAID
jgi:hypothetical protein